MDWIKQKALQVYALTKGAERSALTIGQLRPALPISHRRSAFSISRATTLEKNIAAQELSVALAEKMDTALYSVVTYMCQVSGLRGGGPLPQNNRQCTNGPPPYRNRAPEGPPASLL